MKILLIIFVIACVNIIGIGAYLLLTNNNTSSNQINDIPKSEIDKAIENSNWRVISPYTIASYEEVIYLEQLGLFKSGGVEEAWCVKFSEPVTVETYGLTRVEEDNVQGVLVVRKGGLWEIQDPYSEYGLNWGIGSRKWTAMGCTP